MPGTCFSLQYEDGQGNKTFKTGNDQAFVFTPSKKI